MDDRMEAYVKGPHRVGNLQFAINQYKSYMIVYYRACQSSHNKDWFDAARLSKQFEYSLRKLSFWQKIRFMWFLHNDTESLYKGEF